MNNLTPEAICLGGIVVAVVWILFARYIRRRKPFPIPYFMVYIIDNPIRRLIQPLHKVPEHLGLETGMRVLEIGPGKGTYTLAAAEAVGPSGYVVAVDIDNRIIQRLKKRLLSERVTNIDARQGDAQVLDLPDHSFDVVFAITVFGEIPDRACALAEFRRVLKPGGTLALSEFLPDPDYHPPEEVQKECVAAGFQFYEKTGNPLYYTMLFRTSGEDIHGEHQVNLDHP